MSWVSKAMALNEPRAFASLSSGLLARKGAAKPAMRPQGFGQMGASLEDLGWNDMGFEPPKPTVGGQERDATHDAFGDAVTEQPLRSPVAALTPSPVHGQQADLAQRLASASDSGDEEHEEDEATDEIHDPLTPVAAAAAERAAVPTLSIKPRITVATQPPVAQIAPEPVASTEDAHVTVAQALPAAAPPQAGAVETRKASGPKAAFTLRLEASRHLKLRLACALTGRSAQMLVTEAVDQLLNSFPELDTIAGQLPEGGRSRRA